MSIKQNGGVFGRNPTFNDVTIDGTLTFDGDIDINSDLKIDGNLEVTGTSTLTGNVEISTGNLVIGTSGKGIDFSATAGTGTSELLSDYEEGNWTPDYTAWTTAPTFSAGRYIKIGSQVTVVVIGQNGANAGDEAVAGLPFANSSGVMPTGALKIFGSGSVSTLCNIDNSATSIRSFEAITPSGYWSLSVTYFITF